MKATLILLCGLALASPAAAQDEPKLSILANFRGS